MTIITRTYVIIFIISNIFFQFESLKLTSILYINKHICDLLAKKCLTWRYHGREVNVIDVFAQYIDDVSSIVCSSADHAQEDQI